MNTIKAGIIGFGYMGHFHLNKARQLEELDVVSAYDIDAEKRADAANEGLTVYDTLESFLADETISLVFICTPNNVHAELAIASLQAGKHVMCEKPVTMDSAELEQVIAAAERRTASSPYTRTAAGTRTISWPVRPYRAAKSVISRPFSPGYTVSVACASAGGPTPLQVAVCCTTGAFT